MEKKALARPEIDILKAVAVVAVILIHVFSIFRFSFEHLGSLEANFNLATDQFLRFSVPVFVAMSGLGLYGRYGEGRLDLKNFIRRRLLKLLPWYLFWATVIILTVTFVFHGAPGLYDHLPLWKLYLLGKADIHLYFIPMIVQLYLLFPILAWIFRRFGSKWVLLAALFWQVFWYGYIGLKTEVVGNRNTYWTDQQQYFWFYSWIFYFVLGMFLGGRIEKLSRWMVILAWGCFLVGLVWTVGSTFGLIGSGMEITVATRFTRLPVLLYAGGSILVFWWLAEKVGHFWPEVARGLVFLGKRSYLVYLLHTTVLRFFFVSNTLFTQRIGLIPLSILSVGISFLAAEVCARVGAKVVGLVV